MKQLLRILMGVTLLIAVLAIFVHPAVDGPDAAQRRHVAQLLIAAVAIAGSFLLPSLFIGNLPALFVGSRISAPQMLALFCVRQC